ncbi:hypothetical protein B484DRAFT_447665 [Ochromonadaceae sp. CCMP2298]|nr:hypothetical protein B484DRAFT_447665 [Ochromonadaceae sp. CCMP2298]
MDSKSNETAIGEGRPSEDRSFSEKRTETRTEARTHSNENTNPDAAREKTKRQVQINVDPDTERKPLQESSKAGVRMRGNVLIQNATSEWKIRSCELNGSYLTFFRKQKMIAAIHLGQVGDITVVGKISDNDGKGSIFSLHLKEGRYFNVRVTTYADAVKWVKALVEARDKLRSQAFVRSKSFSMAHAVQGSLSPLHMAADLSSSIVMEDADDNIKCYFDNEHNPPSPILEANEKYVRPVGNKKDLPVQPTDQQRSPIKSMSSPVKDQQPEVNTTPVRFPAPTKEFEASTPKPRLFTQLANERDAESARQRTEGEATVKGAQEAAARAEMEADTAAQSEEKVEEREAAAAEEAQEDGSVGSGGINSGSGSKRKGGSDEDTLQDRDTGKTASDGPLDGVGAMAESPPSSFKVSSSGKDVTSPKVSGSPSSIPKRTKSLSPKNGTSPPAESPKVYAGSDSDAPSAGNLQFAAEERSGEAKPDTGDIAQARVATGAQMVEVETVLKYGVGSLAMLVVLVALLFSSQRHASEETWRREGLKQLQVAMASRSADAVSNPIFALPAAHTKHGEPATAPLQRGAEGGDPLKLSFASHKYDRPLSQPKFPALSAMPVSPLAPRRSSGAVTKFIRDLVSLPGRLLVGIFTKIMSVFK